MEPPPPPNKPPPRGGLNVCTHVFVRVLQVRFIVHTLSACTHNGFPVMGRKPDSGERYIMGIVLRTQLHTLLAHPACLQASSSVCEASSRLACTFRCVTVRACMGVMHACMCASRHQPAWHVMLLRGGCCGPAERHAS